MMKHKRVLLVEDDPHDVELALLALKECNLENEVMVAWNGEQALDYLCRRGHYKDFPEGLPDIVFLDLKMPKMDGLEVLEEIKSDQKLRAIPVVMLTSSRHEQDIVKSYRYGINAYVVKPVAFEKFVEVVKQLGSFWVLTNLVPHS